MFIGNILSTDYTRPLPKFINVVKDKESLVEGVPTLVVGKKTAEELYGKQNVRILNRSISCCVTWCYSLREKADDYEVRVDEFIRSCLSDSIKRISYRYVNLETIGESNVRNLLRYIRYNKRRKTVFINNKHVYIYDESKPVVIGVSIGEAEYLGVSEDRVRKILFSNRSNVLYKDYYKLDFSIKKLFGNDIWLVPYIFSA